jgi:Polyketide cyclase / dehydrase and lipid transport
VNRPVVLAIARTGNVRWSSFDVRSAFVTFVRDENVAHGLLGFASMSRTVDRRTTMADATTYEDVALPAEQVWKVIGNFANIRAWAVVVQDEMVEEGSAGKIRILTMPDGTVVKEALVVSSQYSYTYTIVNRPGLEDYRATVAVIPLDEATSRIELILHVGKSAGETDEELTVRYTRFVRGNLKAMKKALNLA